MNRDLLIDTVLRLSLNGESAPAIGRRLLIPTEEVQKIIKEELAVKPGTIGSFHRKPGKGSKVPRWKRERMAELYEQGVDTATIAAEVGITEPVVRFYLRRDTDYQPPRKRYWTAQEDRYLVEHLHIPMKEIAKTLGRPLGSVQQRYIKLRRMGVMAYRRKPRREYG